MLEEELSGRTVLLERAVRFHYDIRLADSSGAPVGEPVARASNAGGLMLGSYTVVEGERMVLRYQIGANVPRYGPFSIWDGSGLTIGGFEGNTRSIRSWTLRDAEGRAAATVERRSPPIYYLRILLNQLFLEAVYLPYRYVFLAEGREIGSFRRLPRMRRRYALELVAGLEQLLDPRLALAMAIELANLEEVG